LLFEDHHKSKYLILQVSSLKLFLCTFLTK
jgi:hypothetical protein